MWTEGGLVDSWRYQNPLALCVIEVVAFTLAFALKRTKGAGERDDRSSNRERVEKQKQNYAEDREQLLQCPSEDIQMIWKTIWKAFFYVKISGEVDSMFLGVTVSLEFHGHLQFWPLTLCTPEKVLLSTDFNRKTNLFRLEELLKCSCSWKMKTAEEKRALPLTV